MVALTEKAVERRMFGLFLPDHIVNQTLCRLSGVEDILVTTGESKSIMGKGRTLLPLLMTVDRAFHSSSIHGKENDHFAGS